MAADLPIPVFESLAEIYPATTVPREGVRWAALTDKFQSLYGAAPTQIARAPGRVNILGEHVDYSLFPVLPAAIEQDIIIALRPTSSTERKVRVANILPSFKPSEFSLVHSEKGWDAGLVAPKDGGGWENYLKVAILECLDKFYPNGPEESKPVGLDLLIAGNVPPGAGLSSSAAFVVGSVIMFLVANGLTEGKSKGDVVRLAIASEHRMGLQTGGMDQASSALCLANSLLHLSFHPNLEPVPLPLPPSLAVVITNSLAPHSLADSAPERYNLRVVEVLCASRLLLHAWGVDAPRMTKAGKEGRIWLKEALDMWEKKNAGESEEQLYQRILDELPAILGKDGRDKLGWTPEEMVAASGMSADDFKKTYMDFVPVRAKHFHLYLRAQHTFAESLRVARFTSLCKQAAASPELDVSAELGQLINEAHDSIRDLYDATVPEVEELRDLCLKNGALGARQTGGGWGGAVISLLPVDKVPSFVEAIKKQYPPFAKLSKDELDEAAFATLPGVGAGVYEVRDKLN